MHVWLIQVVFGVFLILRSLPLLAQKFPKRYPAERIERIEERGYAKDLSKKLFLQDTYLGLILIAMGLVQRFSLLEGLAFALVYIALFIVYMVLSLRFYHDFMRLSAPNKKGAAYQASSEAVSEAANETASEGAGGPTSETVSETASEEASEVASEAASEETSEEVSEDEASHE